MDVSKLRQTWTALGADDPLWIVLTRSDKKGHRWDPDEFFATGRDEIQRVLGWLASRGFEVRRGRALDFGCGVGRLTYALAEHFEAVDGVDISTSMLEQARALRPTSQRVTFHLNVQPDLRDFASGSFDFIYSNICLHHIPPKLQRRYIAEIARLLKPTGVAHFQATHAHGWRRLVPNRAADLVRWVRHRGRPFVPIYPLPMAGAQRPIEAGGGRLASLDHQPYVGWESRFVMDYYTVIPT